MALIIDFPDNIEYQLEGYFQERISDLRLSRMRQRLKVKRMKEGKHTFRRPHYHIGNSIA